MTPEGQIKSDITKALKQMGFEVFRIQCGQVKVKGGWLHGAPNGTADLMIPVTLSAVAPAILWLETKTREGQLSEEQKCFKRSRRSGQYYLLARSVDDVLGWLKENRASA